MAETNPLKVRGGHVGYLKQLYVEAGILLESKSQVSSIIELFEKIELHFKRYIDAHHSCLESSPPEALVKNHEEQLTVYQTIKAKIESYVKDCKESLIVDGASVKSPSVKSTGSKSHSSRSSASNKTVKSKIKLQVLELKMKQLREQQELEQQQEELKRQIQLKAAKDEIEETKLELDLWEEAASQGTYDDKSITQQDLPSLEFKEENIQEKLNLPQVSQTSVSDISDLKPSAAPFIPASVPKVLIEPNQLNQNAISTSVSQNITQKLQMPSFTPSVSLPKGLSVNKDEAHISNRWASQHLQTLGYDPAVTTTEINNAVPSYTHDCDKSEVIGYVPPTNSFSQGNALSKVLLDLNLPKPELMVFNGDARNYQSFITNFETHIGSKVSDPSTKLTYLMQYCSGEVKQLIRNCVLMSPSDGYYTALSLLKEHFGQNHVIARSYIDGITQGLQVKANDIEGLVKFSREVVDCQIVLSQLKYTSDMNSSETIWCIAKRLPNHLHAKWVDQAATILQSGREPCYNDICRFIEAKSKICNTVYGRKYAELLKTRTTNIKAKPQKPKMSTLVTQVTHDQGKQSSTSTSKLQYAGSKESVELHTSQVKENLNCVKCKMLNHVIENCYKFKNLSLIERLEFVKSEKLCFRCLKSGHFSKDCNVNCEKCQRRHHVLLHDEGRTQHRLNNKDQNVNSSSGVHSNSINVNSATKESSSRVCLGIIPVKLQGNNTSINTYALLDSGSNTTLLRRDLYNSLELDGAEKSFTVQTLSGRSSMNHQLEASITIASLSNEERVTAKALTVKDLPVSLNCLPSSSDINKWDHLKGISIPEIEANEVGVLIGTNIPEMFWSLEEKHGNRGEPIARRTLLGWTVIGPIGETPSQNSHQVNLIEVDSLQYQLKRQWEVDFQDISSEIKEMSSNDKAALDIMNNTVKMVNGKYELSIPWKIDPNTLPNNRHVAETRLRFLRNKFERDSNLKEQYIKTVTKYISDGHACIVKSEDISSTPEWYLPHHPVFKHSNPEKCRVVFDCSAKYKGISLNEAIYQGPNLLNNLAGVLTRFRKEPVALVADIEAMFHQCYVREQDQKFLRFLWWPDGDITRSPSVYAMQVHLFGATSSPSVANFCIRKTCEDNKGKFSEHAIDTVLHSFYMDDLLKSLKSVDEAIKMTTELKELLNRGGFNLTKWISTHREVIHAIPEEDRAKSLKNVNITETPLPQEPALGLQWNVEHDSFTYNIHLKEKPLTRRGLLSMTASLFDPLGFVCPVLLIPKLIQQELCKIQLQWDENLPVKEAQDFITWQQSLDELSSVFIKRCFKSHFKAPPQQVELHMFSDASEFAYGAAGYIKLYNSMERNVQLIMGKSRVAPLKSITIPRLELTAATLAAKLYNFLVQELNININRVYFWTDSMIVLQYLQNTSTRFKRFVSNRIQLIQDLTNINDWNHVPSRLNPADLASRGIQPQETKKLNYWLQGPAFLWESDNYQSVLSVSSRKETLEDLEVKNSFAVELVTDIENFMQYFSHFNKLLVSVAWLRKFITYLKYKSKGENISDIKAELSVLDIQEAEHKIIYYIQTQRFTEEIKCIKQNKEVPVSSSISSLCPIYEDSLVKVGGRLASAEGVINKHPVILPNHHVTDLIARQIHEQNGHVGVNHCLAIIRKQYFPLKGYATVRRVVKSCIPCKRGYKNPCKQKMADLPTDRTILDNPPFTATGIDYLGPLFVKYGRGTAKRYVCLFTCLVTRAVHLEVAYTLDTDSFLMAFHRFMSRRGKPTKVWSDNGRNFVGAEKELKYALQQMNSKKLKDTFLLEAIEWNFLPPHAPHMGGVWERLVRSVKTVFKSLVKQQLLTDEQLVTFICEVEKILNDRPLTTVSSDVKDDLPLTPNHLLLMKRNDCSPTTGTNYVQRRWEVIQQMANKFYARFVSEYLPTLQQRNKWRKTQENLKINDIVLVMDETLSRGEWPLGLVLEVNYGRDNLVRSAKVKVQNTVKVRPVTKLVLLEHSVE